MKISDVEQSPAVNGKWFPFVHPVSGKAFAGTEVKIASSDREEYTLALAERGVERTRRQISRGGRRALGKSIPSAKESLDVTIEALAEHVLLEWKGIQDDDGKDLPCSHENKLLLLHKLYFRDFVIACADDQAAFEEQELGNLPSSQPSTSG